MPPESATSRAAQRTLRLLLLVVVGGSALWGCSATPVATGGFPPEAPTRASSAPPDALPRLAASVDSIGEGAPALDQQNLSRLLRLLADGIQPASPATSLRLRDVAQRLHTSPPGLLTHPRLLKEGLAVLLDGLLTVRVPTDDTERYRRALLAFDEAGAGVHELSPFSEQATAINAALRAATDAVFLARGQRPPFDEAAALAVPAIPVGSLNDELQQALASVSELARADWMGSRRAASRALASLADVIEAADGGKRFGEQVHDVRFQAERLGLSETRSFSQGKWVKVALTRVLDAWQGLEWNGSRPAAIWGRSAQAAVAAIDEHSALSFQRGAIQDAFRTTLAAFLAAAEVCVF